MAAKKAASKKTSTKSPKRAAKTAKKTAKKAAKKRASKKAKEPPGASQSGTANGSAVPFATTGGRPTVTAGAGRGPASPQAGANVAQGGPGHDIDQTEVPGGGTVLRADPSAQAAARGAVGNPGTASAQSPFKNLR